MFTIALCGIVLAVMVAFIYHGHLHSGNHLGEWSRNTRSKNGRLGSGQMFDGIARVYDSANMVMSLGLHHMWKDVLVEKMDIQPGDRVVDVATGTGDIAMKLATSMLTEHPSAPRKQKGEAPSSVVGSVLGLDPSTKMLDIARDKILARGLQNVITLMQGDGEELVDLPDSQFDKLTISFGIRNFSDRERGLAESRRVLKRDNAAGKVGILEFVAPQEGPLSILANIFLLYCIPMIGALMSGGMVEEYAYLKESIVDFPNPSTFADMMTSAGFSNCRYENVFMHTVYVWTCDTFIPEAVLGASAGEATGEEEERGGEYVSEAEA